MKKYIYLLAFLMVAPHIFAQTTKVFITRSGKYTSNSNKGISYLLVQKLDGDSAYLATMYDMQNNLLEKGTYEDRSLTIPNGKFVFYKKLTPDKNESVPGNISPQYYKATTGYFLNGQHAGTWNEYSPQGQVITEYTYQNNELNGPYKVYDVNADLRGEGTVINGKLQGNFKWYNNDNLLVSESNYINGNIKGQMIYYKAAKERIDLHSYMEKSLRKYRDVIYDQQFTVKYNVTKDGRITNPQIVNGFTSEINNTIIAALTNFEAYKPANYNNMPVDQKIVRTISIYPTISNFHIQHSLCRTTPTAPPMHIL